MKSLDKLNFFYMSNGSFNKLKKMQGVAQTINDPMLRFNTALYLGDIQERVKMLAETGQSNSITINYVLVPLAYLTAKAHGLTDYEKTLEESINSMEGVDKDQIFANCDKYLRKSKAILPLRPVFI